MTQKVKRPNWFIYSIPLQDELLISLGQNVITVESRFFVSRFYVKSRIYVEMSDGQIQSLLNNVSQFYVISRFYDAFASDQQYRKIEMWLYL